MYIGTNIDGQLKCQTADGSVLKTENGTIDVK